MVAGDGIIGFRYDESFLKWRHLCGPGSGRAGSTSSRLVDNDWVLRGVDDVEGDGTADIVWQHISGQVHYWPLRAGSGRAGSTFSRRSATTWVLRGVGDVDGVYPSSIAFRFAASPPRA